MRARRAAAPTAPASSPTRAPGALTSRPASSLHADRSAIAALQATAGNRAVARLFGIGGARTSAPRRSSSSQAPIQRCAADPACVHQTDPCPIHKTLPPFSTAADPTLAAFLKPKGWTVPGQSAFDSQLKGVVPASKDDVRVKAVNGNGLHEGLPTDLATNGTIVDAMQKPGGDQSVAPGIQAGLRITTATPLRANPATGPQLGAHIGMFEGNKGTDVSAAAHDELRVLPNSASSVDDQVGQSFARLLRTLPHGQDIMGSKAYDNAKPKGGAIGALEPVGSAQMPNRIAFARQQQRIREAMKDRGRARGVDGLSQPRDDIDTKGGGGGFSTATRATSPVPPIAGHPGSKPPPNSADARDRNLYAANLSAYYTQPGRSGFVGQRTQTCANCNQPCALTHVFCPNCGDAL